MIFDFEKISKIVSGYIDGKRYSHTLYVTKGIGTTKLPLRFMAKPEIVTITLK